MRIQTELAVGVILVLAILVGFFTVISFDKTAQDMEKIQKAAEANQATLNEVVKNRPKVPVK
ncbi:MAG: hypothetical protein ACD_7C00511G0010 [uncultured bacterium]